MRCCCFAFLCRFCAFSVTSLVYGIASLLPGRVEADPAWFGFDPAWFGSVGHTPLALHQRTGPGIGTIDAAHVNDRGHFVDGCSRYASRCRGGLVVRLEDARKLCGKSKATDQTSQRLVDR